MFQTYQGSVQFPKLEVEVLEFWKKKQIYEKSLAQRDGAQEFIFYEGPPTANGLPHPGHCLTRAIKDLFPRYRTMRGYRCERKAGWDTHGLPVEVEVCKELGIHSKEEIEAYGIEPFIQKCQQSVWRYMQEWERLTERLGFWIHLEDAYVTYHQSYVESVWWALKNLFDRGLLYQGHKIVWWWAQGGTALSAGEVGQGYREVADPSVYVLFPLLDDDGNETDENLLVWTTTPWTLPSNQFAAVSADLEYSLVTDEETGKKFYLASALVETVAGKAGTGKEKRELKVEETAQGADLLGRRYLPPFDFYYQNMGDIQGNLTAGEEQHQAWRIIEGEFVTTDAGTGIVHIAPAFGEDDYKLLANERERFVDGEGPDIICAVGPDGKFTEVAGDYQGRWVKEADKDITRQLKAEGKLFHQEQYLHEYPFCWRADEDPLIQYPRESWFVKTTQYKDQMLQNNSQINWLPEHIRDGRFGNFLESNVDWALSRERYWGTPLPIWVCEETGYMEAISNYEELLAKPGITGTEVWEQAKEANPELPDDLRVHKPYIDEVTYDSPKASGKRMRRVTEVIDCWFDSGAMPFAQWGYPQTNKDKFKEQFPADFISEAIDQTRGWFYSQLAISTLLFGDENSTDEDRPKTEFPHPFKNCIVLGLMLSEWYEDAKAQGKSKVYLTEEDGKADGVKKLSKKVGKMSKSLRNYRSPNEIFDMHGADALRWYFFANQAPWNSIIYSERAIKESIPEFLLRLWNVYSFFATYAVGDGFNPSKEIAGDADQLRADVLARAEGYRPVEERGELDAWILSELQRTVKIVTERMDEYDNYSACKELTAFVDSLSNWYVRRSRPRYWAKGFSTDKADAYWTLYECLLTTTKLIAPFVPFVAETLWQNLAANGFGERVKESVHLCDFPTANESQINKTLSQQMAVGREVVSLALSARASGKLKVRQPLSKVEVILADKQHQAWLEKHSGIIAEEVNVKAVEFTQNADQYISYNVLPELKRLGPRLGKQLPQIKKALSAADPPTLLKEMNEQGKVTLQLDDGPVDLDQEDLLIRMQAKEGWTAAQGNEAVVVLSTEITEELAAEGLVREVTRVVQNLRKENDFNYLDRIRVGITTDDHDLKNAIEKFGDYIQNETLAPILQTTLLDGVEPTEVKLPEATLQVSVEVIEGLGDLVRELQALRSSLACEETATIAIGVVSDNEAVTQLSKDFATYLQGEVNASSIGSEALSDASSKEVTILGSLVSLYAKLA